MEVKKYEDKDFEFILLMNDRIIVKRNFDIIGYNPKAINSMNFREGIDHIFDSIQEDLRTKSIKYMLHNINGFYDNPKMESNDSKDVIIFEVRDKGVLIASRRSDATIYPAKIRYTVNIKDNIYDIITTIQKSLSLKYLKTKYLGYDLAAF